MARLDLYANFKLFVKMRLTEKEVVIGRGIDCAIQLPFEQVSRQHAKIVDAGGGSWVIENLSPNGTRLNAAMISAPATLKPGDRIYIESAILIFQPDDAESEEIERRRTVLRVPAVRPPEK
jgi:pSer/pThr/pTyr-binding forkhead associated (FHA) protein